MYRAEQRPLGRVVALKVIHGALAHDPKGLSRFWREAKIAASLTNPHTVTIYDFGRADDGTLYLAMEFLAGENLHDHLARVGRLPLEKAAVIGAQVCRSLMEAHKKGIVHRDLKPENIFLTVGDDDKLLAKVLDYGLARVVTGENSSGPTVTQVGTIVGTPTYMSPEQARGRRLDPRSDLYTFGVVLFEMLAGKPPFRDDDAIMLLSRHLRDPVPSLAAVAPGLSVPKELEALIQSLMQKQPEDRPADAATVHQALLDAVSLSRGTSSDLPSIPALDILMSDGTRLSSSRLPKSGVQVRRDSSSDTLVVGSHSAPTVAAPAQTPDSLSPPSGRLAARSIADHPTPLDEHATVAAEVATPGHGPWVEPRSEPFWTRGRIGALGGLVVGAAVAMLLLWALREGALPPPDSPAAVPRVVATPAPASVPSTLPGPVPSTPAGDAVVRSTEASPTTPDAQAGEAPAADDPAAQFEPARARSADGQASKRPARRGRHARRERRPTQPTIKRLVVGTDVIFGPARR